ncbi:MAG: proline dehydrogenase [Candidatus Acidiferrum sp.]
MIRRALLKASENPWLRQHASHSRFLGRAVRRFLPGETLAAALAACHELAKDNLGTLLTYLGENVTNRDEARAVTSLYVALLPRVRSSRLSTEVSLKLTQLGLDLDSDFCFDNLATILKGETPERTIWIDMEQSAYVERTLQIFERARFVSPNVGVCVQAYLRRTAKDVEKLIELGAAIRLVKGAYNEPAGIAFPTKREVDENYFNLAQRMLSSEARKNGVRAALATHDRALINRITARAASEGMNPAELEFQMLYGIQREEQRRLAGKGYRSYVLISYGSFWFPWFMRRLAERPANLLFLARNLFER